MSQTRVEFSDPEIRDVGFRSQAPGPGRAKSSEMSGLGNFEGSHDFEGVTDSG